MSALGAVETRSVGFSPMIRRLVDGRPAEEDHLAVLRYVISRLGDGHATFAAGMSRARRRELVRLVFECHRERRERAASVARSAR